MQSECAAGCVHISYRSSKEVSYDGSVSSVRCMFMALSGVLGEYVAPGNAV